MLMLNKSHIPVQVTVLYITQGKDCKTMQSAAMPVLEIRGNLILNCIGLATTVLHSHPHKFF